MREIDFGPYRGVAQEPEGEQSWREIFRQNVEDMSRVSAQNAKLYNQIDVYDQISDRIRSATGAEVVNPLRSGPTAFDRGDTSSGWREALDPHAEWRRSVSDLKLKHPDALPWDDILTEPERRAYEIMRETREKTDAQNEQLGLIDKKDVPIVGGVPVLGSATAFMANAMRSPRVTSAQVLGGLYGSLSSPTDTMVNLLGFATGGAASSLLKNAAANGLTNAAAQAPLSAFKQFDYQKAGLPYGWAVWREEVEGAAATGAGLDLAIRGPSRAVLRRYGRDVAPGEALSRNTPRGGLLTDAIEAPSVPKPRPSLDINPETIRKAEAGDLDATKEILAKTGQLDDPAVRGALHHLETGEKLSREQLDRLESIGVARSDGVRLLSNVLNGVEVVDLPSPIKPAPQLVPDDGNALLAKHFETIRQALAPDIARAVEVGLETGLPEIVAAVRKLDAGVSVTQAFADVSPRTISAALLHGASTDPLQMAAIIRATPDIVDASMPVDMGHMRVARLIATLDQAAFEDVARGSIPAEVAAMIAERVPRVHHAAVVRQIATAKPESHVEAAQMIRDMTPGPDRSGQPLDGGAARAVDPASHVESLKQAAGQGYADAMAPLVRRQEIEAKVESLKGEIAKLEEDLRASNDTLASFMERQDAFAGDIFIRPDDVAKAKGGTPPAFVDAMGTALRLAQKRLELRQLEASLAEATRLAYPTEDGAAMARLAMRALALKRETDVARAVIDALDFGRRLVPDGARIEVLPDEQLIYRLANGESAQLNASSDSKTGHIQLAMHAVDPSAKMGHEAVHTLVTLGHIAPDEVRALAGLAREAGTFAREADYRKAYAKRVNIDGLIDEEAAASYIEARIRGDVKGPDNTVINRLKELFERIKQLLAGHGFKSREDIASALLNGDMARREARADWTRAAQTEGRAAMRAAMDEGVALPDGSVVSGVPLFSIKAFHGSPHDFDRFDMSKIGTGEGAQAYGRGLYFAEKEATAKSYRDAVVPQSYAGTPEHTLALVARQINKGHDHGQKVIETLGRMGERDAALMAKRLLAEGKPLPDMPPGRMYEVKINADPEQFLDWDKPLSQQPEGVRKAIGYDLPLAVEAEAQRLTKQLEDTYARLGSSKNRRPVDPILVRQTDDLERRLAKIDPKGLSKYRVDLITNEPGAVDRLREAGIPGIKYLDQGSRAAGQGSRNYVVFDDSLIEIVAKDGVPILPDDKLASLADRDTGQSMRRDLDKLGFYSKALEAAKGLKQAKGTPEQMLAQLKKAGVKDAEIEATGLADLFREKAGSTTALESDAITLSQNPQQQGDRTASPPRRARLNQISKSDIVKHLEENRVGLREVTYAGDKMDVIRRRGELEDERRRQLAQPLSAMRNRGRLAENTSALAALDQRAGEVTKWSSYSLDPSNPTYRETVLHLPGFDRDQLKDKIVEIDRRRYQAQVQMQDLEADLSRLSGLRGRLTPGRSDRVAQIEAQLSKVRNELAAIDRDNAALVPLYHAEARDFVGSHFRHPNVIGHMMTSMTEHEGKPVYTIDQIQSDWGQRLRDDGARDEAKIAALKAKSEAANEKFIEAEKAAREAVNNLKAGGVFSRRPSTAEIAALQDAASAAADEARRLRSEYTAANTSALPNPLVNTTDQWTTTTLRRAIRQAVEAGAEYIAIPHGDTVLSYNPGDGNGMRGFYGSRDSEGIVPKNLRKILTGLDKESPRPVKVETLETPSGSRGYRPDPQGRFDKAQTGFTLFPITDAIKAEVAEKGLPLFSLGSRLDNSLEARKERAEALGFDTNTTWFHGTRAKFNAFDPSTIGDNFRADERGFFFINDPKQAGEYATSDSVGLPADGGSVIPSYLRMKNPLIIDDMRLRKEGMEKIGVNEDVVSFWDNYQSLILEWADKQRADGVVLVDNTYKQKTKNRGQPTMLAVVFDPSNIRSVNADFDPAKSGSANLMASLSDPVDLKSEMAMVDRLSTFKTLIEACRA